MMIFISCAKTMAQTCPHTVPYVSEPEYLPYAEKLVKKMSVFSEDELADALKVSPRIAAENKMRYTDIMHGEAEMMPAVFAYTGVVFKHIAAELFSHGSCICPGPPSDNIVSVRAAQAAGCDKSVSP